MEFVSEAAQGCKCGARLFHRPPYWRGRDSQRRLCEPRAFFAPLRLSLTAKNTQIFWDGCEEFQSSLSINGKAGN